MEVNLVDFGKEVIEISCKEFAKKYEKYAREIEKNIFNKDKKPLIS